MIGRERELARLVAGLADGPGARLLAVLGPAGSGKSALVEAALAAGEEETARPVRRHRGVAWERDIGYGVLQQLAPTAGGDSTDPVQAAMALASTAPGPTLLLLEDAQWVDEPTLQTLVSLRRRHPEVPLTVVVVLRPGAGIAEDLLRRAADEVISLAPWRSNDVRTAARRFDLVLRPTVADALARHTSGNPGQVLALLAEQPHETWRATRPRLGAPRQLVAEVGGLLDRLDEPALRLVRAIAVLSAPVTAADPSGAPVGPLSTADPTGASTFARPHASAGQRAVGDERAGDKAAWDLVARLAEVGDPLSAADRARATGLLDPDPAVPALAAPVLAAAVLECLGAAGTAELHRRAAGLVVSPDLRLAHLVAATVRRDAGLADELAELAEERAREGAWSSAAALLLDASDLSIDPLLHDQRLTRAVDALVGAGDSAGASALVPVLESLRETPLRNAVLGYLAILHGRSVEAGLRLNRAWEIVNAERDPGTAATICTRQVLHALACLQGGELVTWADRALALVGPDVPAGTESAAIRELGVAAAGRPQPAMEAYATLATRVGDGAQGQRVAMGRGWLHLAMDEVEEARAELERSVPMTYLGGSTRVSLWARGWLARVQFETGQWDLALETVAAGRSLGERSGTALTRPLQLWTEVQVRALRGEWELAEQVLREAEEDAGDYPIMRVPRRLARAAVEEARADYAAVVRTLMPLTQYPEGSSVHEPGSWPWVDVLANALVIESEHDRAEALLGPYEERARERGHASEQARLAYPRGRLLGGQGRIDEARGQFERSLELLDPLPLRYQQARVLFAYGQTLRRAGKRRDADRMLGSARDRYAALGAVSYVERCDRELRAGGLHQRGEREVGDLTPQEQSVAGMVAGGMSNREAATELFISTKTVQYHLTRIYQKLGVRSRSELAARYREAPEADPR